MRKLIYKLHKPSTGEKVEVPVYACNHDEGQEKLYKLGYNIKYDHGNGWWMDGLKIETLPGIEEYAQ